MTCLLDGDPRDPRVELAQLISTISEELYFAGWHMGIEEFLWGELREETRAHPSAAEQYRRLRELSSQIRGWVYWDDDVGGVRFVPLDEWLRMFADTAPKGLGL